MPKGETTTIRPPQGDGKALAEWRRVTWRNATLEDLQQALREKIGTTFKIDAGDTYRVVNVELDWLKRLIEVGVQEMHKVEASEKLHVIQSLQIDAEGSDPTLDERLLGR